LRLARLAWEREGVRRLCRVRRTYGQEGNAGKQLMSDFELELKHSCEETVRRITGALERHGLRVVRSFDLRSALKAEGVPYECPRHGTQGCTCNYVVLSVYLPADGPACLPNQIVIRDHDGSSRLSLPLLPGAWGQAEEPVADPRLLRALAEVFDEASV
jgi:hypothetical protein